MGATMFTLLTGRLVHEAETVNELLLAAMTKPAPKLASLMPGVSPAIAGIVDRALAYAPADRWPDAQTMQSAVKLVLQGLAVDARGPVDMADAFTVKVQDQPLPLPVNVQDQPLPLLSPLPPPPVFVPVAFARAPSFSQPTLALTPAGGMATGHPVTIGAARAGAPAAGRGKAGLIFAGVAAAALLAGTFVWAISGHTPPVPADQPLASPSPSATAETQPSAIPSTSATEPPVPSSVPLAASASASASAVKASAPTPVVVPLKPKPKSEQELLNRRR
jgi:serine/threonine-protein kinase